MKWKLKFNRPVNNKEERIKYLLRKENPTEEEQIEVVEWVRKNKYEEFEKALKNIEAVEKSE